MPGAATPHGPENALAGLTVFERGWLSSNNILVHAEPAESGALLIDTGHVNHAEQTLALVRGALAGQPLARIVNTHLHSDHCGGNATLQRAFDAPVSIPPGQADAVRTWDESRLSYRATGQRMAPFAVDAVLRPGELLRCGGRCFEVLPAPGHDPDSVMLYDAANRLLISADALWENGFGVVFPELAGEPGFDDVAAVLDAIGRLRVDTVIPGHGAPFTDVAGALGRARSRLAAFRADPLRHARHGVKVLIKYHLMEEREQSLDALRAWIETTPTLVGAAARVVPAPGIPIWCEGLVDELVAAGALVRQGDLLRDA